MSNSYLGDSIETPGGTLSSPAQTVLNGLNTSGLWYKDMMTVGDVDSDTMAVVVDCIFLMYIYRSYENQKWLQAMSIRAVTVSGNTVLRVYPRSISSVLTLEGSLKAIGCDCTLPAESFTGTAYSDTFMVALNTALKPFYIQIFRA